MARSSTFTTYFNSQVDTTGGAKLDALANQATSAYDRIADAAARAAAASGLVGGSGSGGLGTATANLDRQAASARALGVASAAAGTSTDRFTAATIAAGRASGVAAVENEALNTSLKSTATALAVIQGPLGPVAGRIRALSSAVGEFSVSTLGLIGAGGALFAIAALGNQYDQLETKLRPFFASQQATNNALAEVAGIAQSSRAALEPIADLYVRLTTLQKELGAGTNIATLASTIAKASTLSGGSAENQAEGIRQLTQGLGRGILNGQDLRALEEDSFNLAKTIADGLGVNVGQLKQLGAEGKLTTDVVTQALLRQQDVVAAQFAKLPPTITAAGQQFKNATEIFIGGLNQSTGLTNSLADALLAVANNIRPIVTGGAAIAAAFAVPKGGAALLSYIDNVTSKLAQKNALMNATDASNAAGLVNPGAEGTTFSITDEGKQQALAASAVEQAQLQANAAARAKENAQANLDYAKQEVAAAQSRVDAIIQVQSAEQADTSIAVAGAQARLAAVKDEVAQEAALRLAAAQADVDAAAAAVAVAKQRVKDTASALAGAQQRVVAAQQTGASAASDPSLTRASSARIVTQAARDEALAEAEVTIALQAQTDASEALAAAQGDLTTARKTANSIGPTADDIERIAAAQTDLTDAYAAETALAEKLGVDLEALNAARTNVGDATIRQNAAQLIAVDTETAETAAVVELTAAQTALQLATDAAAGVQAGFLAGIDGVLALLNPTAIAIGLVTAALVLYTSRTSDLENALDGLSAKQKDQIEQNNKVAESYANLSVAALKAARDQLGSQVQTKAQGYESAKNQLIQNLTTQYQQLSPGDPRQAQLGQIIANYATKGASVSQTYSAYSDLGFGAQATSAPGLLSTAGSLLEGKGGAADQVANSFKTVQAAATALIDVNGNLTEVTGRLADAGKPLPPILSATAKSLTQIRDDAAAAADNGTARVNEDAKHAKAIADLNAKYGAGGEDGGTGKALSGQAAADAQAAYEAEDKRHNAALANIQSEKTAAHSAAVAAKNDALGNAETTKLTSLIALEQNRGNLTQEQYDKQKEAIDATYDTERSRIEANGSISHTSLQQRLADLTALNAAFQKQSEAVTTFSGKYVDGPKPQAQYDAAIAKLRQNENVVDASGKSAFDQTEAAIAASVSPLNKALNDYYRTLQENGVVGQLAAEGLTAQSDALKEALDLQRTQGDVSADQVAKLVQENQAQEKINETLAARQTITNNILGLVDSTKSALATFFETLSAGPGKAVGTLVSNLEKNLQNTLAENLATNLTSGATGAVKSLFASNAPADVAQRKFATTIDNFNTEFGTQSTTFDSSVGKLVSTTDNLNAALDGLTTHVNAAAGSTSGAGGTGLAGLANVTTNIAAPLATTLDTSTAGANLSSSLLASQGADGFFPEATAAEQAQQTGIIVTAATKAAKAAGSATTSPIDALDAIGGSVATKINAGLKPLLAPLGKVGDVIDTGLSTVTTAVGKNLGSLVQGAGIGSLTGSLLFGSNQSATGKVGDQLGGAIGDVLGKDLGKTLASSSSSLLKGLGGIAGPIGSVVGSVLGGLVGGLFSQKPKGGTTITATNGVLSTGTAFGNNSQAEAAATSEASTIVQGINQVATTLGAQITGSPNVTVGTYNGKYRVNTQGTKLGGSSSPVPGLTDFGDDEQAAIQYAIVASIQNGVIKGISQASINILKSGQDLNTALQKALTIENIPKQLEQLTNPVKYAVDTLNTQFQTVIADLNEGGATAAQYAQASTLYDMERATAIQQAAKSVFGTVEDYITDLTSGASSPLNKSTTLANAQTAFGALSTQIDAGQSVDQDDLTTAAKNLLAASSASNGSNTSYFADYNNVLAELRKADATATNGIDTSATQTDLPASPFTTDATAAAAIASLSQTSTQNTQTQTQQLLTGFDAVVNAVNDLASSGIAAGAVSSAGSAARLLTGVRVNLV